MKSLLEALKEGRLVELPDGSDKEGALEFLAHIIEAVPDIGTNVDLLKSVLEREGQANTGIGRGVACPHCRASGEGELLCAVGWSPQGIEYGASDGKRVHLLVMYYVPDLERNAYLKEISGLAKAVSAGDSIETISKLADIHTVREKLLDWVGLAISATLPESKARMIKLEARQATVAALEAAPVRDLAGLRLLPFRLIAWPGSAIALCADPALAEALEGTAGLADRLKAGSEVEAPGWRVVVMSETPFARDRRGIPGGSPESGSLSVRECSTARHCEARRHHGQEARIDYRAGLGRRRPPVRRGQLRYPQAASRRPPGRGRAQGPALRPRRGRDPEGPRQNPRGPRRGQG